MNTKNIRRIVLASDVETKIDSSASNVSVDAQLAKHSEDVPISNYDRVNIDENTHMVTSPDPPGGFLDPA